jgi:hypothetical protein
VGGGVLSPIRLVLCTLWLELRRTTGASTATPSAGAKLAKTTQTRKYPPLARDKPVEIGNITPAGREGPANLDTRIMHGNKLEAEGEWGLTHKNGGRGYGTCAREPARAFHSRTPAR